MFGRHPARLSQSLGKCGMPAWHERKWIHLRWHSDIGSWLSQSIRRSSLCYECGDCSYEVQSLKALLKRGLKSAIDCSLEAGMTAKRKFWLVFFGILSIRTDDVIFEEGRISKRSINPIMNVLEHLYTLRMTSSSLGNWTTRPSSREYWLS